MLIRTHAVMEISGEFYHVSVVADIDKKKIKNIVRKIHVVSRRIGLLKDVKIGK